MSDFPARYTQGQQVRVLKENSQSNINKNYHYTWRGLRGTRNRLTNWIHEDCLESAEEVSEDEVAAAIASITGAAPDPGCQCDIDYLDPKCTNPEHINPLSYNDLLEEVERLSALLAKHGIDH